MYRLRENSTRIVVRFEAGRRRTIVTIGMERRGRETRPRAACLTCHARVVAAVHRDADSSATALPSRALDSTTAAVLIVTSKRGCREALTAAARLVRWARIVAGVDRNTRAAETTLPTCASDAAAAAVGRIGLEVGSRLARATTANLAARARVVAGVDGDTSASNTTLTASTFDIATATVVRVGLKCRGGDASSRAARLRRRAGVVAGVDCNARACETAPAVRACDTTAAAVG